MRNTDKYRWVVSIKCAEHRFVDVVGQPNDNNESCSHNIRKLTKIIQDYLDDGFEPEHIHTLYNTGRWHDTLVIAFRQVEKRSNSHV